jgi:hypothetical protein
VDKARTQAGLRARVIASARNSIFPNEQRRDLLHPNGEFIR